MTQYSFFTSQFQGHPFCLLCEDGCGPFKCFSFVPWHYTVNLSVELLPGGKDCFLFLALAPQTLARLSASPRSSHSTERRQDLRQVVSPVSGSQSAQWSTAPSSQHFLPTHPREDLSLSSPGETPSCEQTSTP
jgi:hypothetical protein